MNPPQNRLDELGFPIPRDFDGYPAQTERRLRLSRRGLRIVGMLALVALFATALWNHFGDDVRKLAAARAAQSALEKQMADDLHGAVEDLDTAIGWAPNEAKLYEMRAMVRSELGELAGSLSDYDRLLALSPSFARGYLGRSAVRQRLGRHQEAIADTTRAIELRPEWDHESLNSRAYTRALAEMQLDEALVDAQKAVELSGGNNAAYLDTRGYLYFLLGKQDAALADLEQALALAEVDKEQILRQSRLSWHGGAMARVSRLMDQNLAVMYHHRGLIREKLGQQQSARDDLQLADRLGYNPAQGIW